MVGIALGLALLTGCANHGASPREDDAEIRQEFRQDMMDDALTAEKLLNQTRRGVDLSQMTLGWFVYDLLSELSSQDQVLYDHFYQSSGGVEGYLRTTFQNNPVQEIDRVSDLAKTGYPTRRLAARYALEVLRHVPDSSDPAATREADRRELASALATLGTLLQRTADEMGPPRP
jgi:hypothetical protein